MNYLDNWHEEMQLVKWKKVLQSDPYFRNLDAIKAELESFFDKGDFEVSDNINPDNWLIHIFANKQISSIYIINEVAELIRYVKLMPNPEAYRFRTNEGKLNYKSLQEKFFELCIHYLLSDAGFKVQIGHHYISSAGVGKEIDILLETDENFYNVEISKFYDVFKEELVGLAETVLRKLSFTVTKNALKTDEVFSGYFAFKLRNEALIKKHKQLIGQQIKKYLQGHRNPVDNTLTYPRKIETDDFEFEIETVFNDHFDTKYDAHLEKFPGSIKFRITSDIKTNKGHIQSKAVCKESIADQNIRLQNKIKQKLRQHRESPYPLLIIIAIEQVLSTHAKNRTIAIRRNEIDTQALHALIRNRAAVVLIFKEVNAAGVVFEKLILGNMLHHTNLLEKLEKLDPVIRYLPVQ